MLLFSPRGSDFGGNRGGSSAGITSARDGPANHEVIRPRANRLGGCRYASLIASCGSGRPDTRHHDQEPRPTRPADRTRFMRRSDHPVQACFLGKPRQGHHPRWRRTGQPNLPEGCGIEARQDGHAEQRRPPLPVRDGISCRPHHGQATRRVQRHHLHVGQSCGSGHRSSYRIWYVVELQIEKNAQTETREPLHRARALGCKELAPDLD